MRVLRFLVLNGIAVGLGAVVATSCIDVNYPTVAFRCNPRQDKNCPDTHFCCSDDPAAVGGGLPAYQTPEGPGNGGTPYFSGLNNALGTVGMCVRTSDLPAGAGLLEPAAANCPVPCNPTWDADDKMAICGANRVCCQTVEIEPEDCILDGDTWRPATGADILAERSNWAQARHETHQDPSGKGCAQFAGGQTSGPDFLGCIEELSVADQRGFCMALQPGEACPTEVEGYMNACEQINAGLIPPPIAGA
jgi:hypothetical protein